MLAGVGVDPEGVRDEQMAVQEWRRRAAVPLDVKAGVSSGVYKLARSRGDRLFDVAEAGTAGFTRFDPTFIHANPHLLPLWQHLAGVFSKAALKRQVGAASDAGFSRPVAERLAELLAARVRAAAVDKGQVLRRLESTLEGIVRDLVGRLLLESIVERALSDRNLPYLREVQYKALAGVVYDVRADFVLPDARAPRAFIEVRKSSSRHASLYAKDKMFSAINWKGRSPDMLGVIVVDGEWTRQALDAMARVFDYVVPISMVAELAEGLGDYLDGDRSKLKWLITFKIQPAS